MDIALGVDLGGSNLRLGTVDAEGRVIDFRSLPISQALRGEEIVARLVQAVRGLEGFAGVEGAGIAVAAALQGDRILPGLAGHRALEDFPLRRRLEEEIGKPCLIDNDANLFLLGEAHFGAARGMKDVLLLTLGTGIGGGLMLDGRLRRGAHSSGVEIGLMLLSEARPGSYVTLESLASPGLLVRELGDPRGSLFARAAEGDERAAALIGEMCERVSWAIANAHILLDLELVLLSGGLAQAGEALLHRVRAAFSRICPAEAVFGLRIEIGALPPDKGGVIGAACLWFEHAGRLSPL